MFVCVQGWIHKCIIRTLLVVKLRMTFRQMVINEPSLIDLLW